MINYDISQVKSLCSSILIIIGCLSLFIISIIIIYYQLIIINIGWKYYKKLRRRNVTNLDSITPDNILKNTREMTQYPITLVLYCLEKNGNISSLVRIADSQGINKIIIIGNKSQINPRVTTGSHNRMIIQKYEAHKQNHDSGKTMSVLDYDAAEKHFNDIIIDNPGNIVFVEQGGDSLEKFIPIISNEKPLYVVIGNERNGIPEDIMNKYINYDDQNKKISITQHGTNPSMNVGTAAAIALHHVANYSTFM